MRHALRFVWPCYRPAITVSRPRYRSETRDVLRHTLVELYGVNLGFY